jgi:aldehyde:ferredoxin oxidoreductase
MSKYSGYMGRVAKVDLTAGTVTDYPWSDRERELYLGGKIMAAKILSDNLTGHEKPLSAENYIVAATGPLTGTGAPSSNRFDLSTLSPQTGYMTSSNCGGNFGYYLKKAGYDALVITGKCAEPTWLEIHNDKFVFHPAADLWGKKITEAQNSLQQKLDDQRGCRVKCGMICIGPAGENLVKYAAVISGERASGRAGVGAVLGFKNLKAVTAAGNHEVPVYDRDKMVMWNKKWDKYLRAHPLTGNQLPKMGTAGLVSSMQMRGILSTKNYKYGKFDGFEKVSGEVLAENYNIVNKGCLSCPIKCTRCVEVDGCKVKGPELETLGLLGGGILNDNLELILKWNKELDDLGLDTISAANTLSWAMEANEKGLWKNGLEFGKTDNISALWEDIAFRRGIGSELAEGSKRLSEKYGGKEFSIQSKGLELAAYEPRRAVGQGLGYAVSNRGGCHLNGGYLVILEGLGLYTDPQTPKGKPDFTMIFQDLMETISASGQCLFTSYAVFPGFLISKPNGLITTAANKVLPYLGPAVRVINKIPRAVCFDVPVLHHTNAIRYATGMPMDFGRYLSIGERGYDTERYVSSRFGVSAAADTLPGRLTDDPQDPNDPKTVVPLKEMKPVYYRARGWNKNGVPTKLTLRRLKIK